MKKKIKISIIAAIGLILLIAIITKACMKETGKVNLVTTKAVIGNINNTVTATGTIEAIKTVEVGTQVSGVIRKIYADFNSVVKKGQLLAEIDKAPLLSQLESSQASLDDVTAEYNYQKSNFDRIKALNDKKLVSQSDYELALYNFQKASASVKIAQSNYNKAMVNLDYASITSPIDGVVLNRAVDEGQTVAASFSTPTLFSIANDLTQMQVQANIDEADIGQVKQYQKVNFTVDAFPDMKFNGEVTEIRLKSTTTSNVVTYTVIIKAPNPDKKLMPGMTASITIITEEANKAITVPAKALRFKPDFDLLGKYMMSLPEKDRPKEMAKSMGAEGTQPMQAGATPNTQINAHEVDAVWIKEGSMIHPVSVKVGINDGTNAEIISGIKEGTEIVTELTTESATTASSGNQTRSPFMPSPPKRK